MDSLGNPIWQANYGVRWMGICEDASIGYMLVGNQVLAHVDANGNMLWEKDMPFSLEKCIRTLDGNYAAVGSLGNTKIALVRFDENGTAINIASFGLVNFPSIPISAYDIKQAEDSSLIVCGSLVGYNFTKEAFLLKTQGNAR
ncbi:MAG: hypothetical protein AAF696_12455, partial [Bacteroidota bacterium]